MVFKSWKPSSSCSTCDGAIVEIPLKLNFSFLKRIEIARNRCNESRNFPRISVHSVFVCNELTPFRVCFLALVVDTSKSTQRYSECGVVEVMEKYSYLRNFVCWTKKYVLIETCRNAYDCGELFTQIITEWQYCNRNKWWWNRSTFENFSRFRDNVGNDLSIFLF